MIGPNALSNHGYAAERFYSAAFETTPVVYLVHSLFAHSYDCSSGLPEPALSHLA